MKSKLFTTHKIPLLISTTLSVVLIAIKFQNDALSFTYIILGSLFGTFILDLDYVIHAYFLEPSSDFSRAIKSFVSHTDPLNALSYANLNKHSVGEKALNSALFQIVLALASLFVISVSANLFVRTLLISTFANSLYRMAEFYFDEKIGDWFWAFRVKPTRKTFGVYSVVMAGVFVFCLIIF